MSDDQENAETKDALLARQMYDRWVAGEKKSALEREYWNDGQSHGQAFSAFVRRHLGVETVERSPMAARLADAEALLRVHGSAVPHEELDEQFRLIARSREAALTALRVYNDPGGGLWAPPTERHDQDDVELTTVVAPCVVSFPPMALSARVPSDRRGVCLPRTRCVSPGPPSPVIAWIGCAA